MLKTALVSLLVRLAQAQYPSSDPAQITCNSLALLDTCTFSYECVSSCCDTKTSKCQSTLSSKVTCQVDTGCPDAEDLIGLWITVVICGWCIICTLNCCVCPCAVIPEILASLASVAVPVAVAIAIVILAGGWIFLIPACLFLGGLVCCLCFCGFRKPSRNRNRDVNPIVQPN